MNPKESIGPAEFTPRQAASVLSLCVLFFPTISILGWIADIRLLASLGPQFIPMAPSTAICFLLAGAVLIATVRPAAGRAVMLAALTAASCVTLYGLLTVLGASSGLPLAPDEWIFPDFGTQGEHRVGRMAALTAFLFVFSGISLVITCVNSYGVSRPGRLGTFSGLSAFVVLFCALVITVGYALGSPLLYDGKTIPMALPTSLTFMLLACGQLLAASTRSGTSDQWFAQIIRNMNVTAQIRLGFNTIVILIVLLGVVVLFQSNNMWQGTKGLYEHPHTVRRALGEIRADILGIQIELRDLLFTADESERSTAIESIERLVGDANRQFEVLDNAYLGPKADIDSAKVDFQIWTRLRNETIRMVQSGQTAEARMRIRPAGAEGDQISKLTAHFDKVDAFARAKGDQFYQEARERKNNLSVSLAILIGIIIALSFIVIRFIRGRISAPLDELTRVTRELKNGNIGTRSTYTLRNEFGALSEAFNDLAETVQMNMDLSNKSAHLAGLMLSEDDARKFFRSTLGSLAQHTGSQMAAAYLRSDDKKHFVHFESIGLSESARQTFDAEALEGEIGTVLSRRAVHHIRDIPADTRFSFPTTAGNVIPREMITIPVLAGKDIVAVISLASITSYPAHALRLIENILETLGARVDGILGYRKMKEFSEQLRSKNSELSAQQAELAAQAGELVAQNRELEVQKKQLDDASRLKTTFLSNMSHELRTPLNSVIALSGVLHRRLAGRLEGEEYGYIEVIERNGKILLGLINDILDIARIESGREEIEITRFTVDSVIDEVATMVSPQAQEKGIRLQHRGGDSPITIESDCDKCRHIFQNIISNAVKFTAKGFVEVSARLHGDNVEVRISDTGIGISADQIPFIFDEFRQADGSMSRKYGGTGLGLAIAKKYAVFLGGRITVTSAPGKGSTFTVTLPLRTTAAKQVAEPDRDQVRRLSPAPSAEHTGNAGDAVILLVEDNESAVVQVRDVLEERGYRLLVARDGSEALAMMEKTVPDGIILDLMMPGMDGFQMLKNVREADRTAGIPVLILTAKHVTKEELKFLTRNNIHQLIQKGDVNRTELLDAIGSMLRPHIDEPVPPKCTVRAIEGKPVVLVVEDNPDNMLTMKALLAGDYTVLEATDGASGIEIAAREKPHLVLIDISLPEKTGIEALKALRSNPVTAHIPVIAVTASAMTTDRETILAHGFDAYVPKPIDAAQFFKCIREVLHG